MATARSTSSPSLSDVDRDPDNGGVRSRRYLAGRHSIRLLGIALLVLGAGSAAAQVEIDDFTDGSQTAPPSNQAAAMVLGGFRDARSLHANNTVEVGSGIFRCYGTQAFQGCTLQYDGDDDPDTFSSTGLSPTNFSAGGQDRIEIATFVDGGACNLLIQLCDNDMDPECSSSQQAISDMGTATFLYSGFSATLDLTGITAVLVNLTPSMSPHDCSISVVATTPVELLELSVD